MEHLYAPWRYSYVSEEKIEGCVFCHIAKNIADEKYQVLFYDELCYVVMNKFPYSPGHMMVIPYFHTDKIEDLVKDVPGVKYYKYDTKMKLGKKRNLMHEKSSGDIIVYMDDDDYYPPERVSHAVNMLQRHPNALCAGASEIYIYFKHIFLNE